eukprot:TRINITY_DN4305_c0_g2_i1.p1 TRINITY_DN4305_c0_g2~~TRINITY_DN4305_c0_g2_i1.p1  ORF type:complete len:870 (-),score=125.05 TRINITY_DN4305_c0_g2_i1:147-2756(-)
MGHTNSRQRPIPIDAPRFGMPRRPRADVDILDLSFSQLSAFPDHVFTEENRENIRQILLWHNLFSSFPVKPLMTNFATIIKVDLSYNYLTNLNIEIFHLPELKTLLLVGNQIRAWPESGSPQSSLTELDLSMNKLSSFPRGIFLELISLQKLSVSRNKISTLTFEPPSIESHPLRHLDLSSNRLDSIGEEIRYLVELENLYLSNNDLLSLPQEVGLLSHLKILELNDNRLEHLFSSISRLSSLEILDLQNNRLTVLPRWSLPADLLNHLRRLQLQDNLLEEYPPCWCNLQNLRELNLTGNRLTCLPNNIEELSSLLELRLGSNRLPSLPPTFCLLNLCQLYLEDNLFTSYPITLCSQCEQTPPIYSQLRILSLSYNNITNLDDFPFESFSSLDTLHLAGNQITSIPMSLLRIQTLRELYLQLNQLTQISSEEIPPSEVPQILPRLRVLDLHLNSAQFVIPCWLAAQIKARVDSLRFSPSLPTQSLPGYDLGWDRRGMQVGKAEMQGRRASMEDTARLFPFLEFHLKTAPTLTQTHPRSRTHSVAPRFMRRGLRLARFRAGTQRSKADDGFPESSTPPPSFQSRNLSPILNPSPIVTSLCDDAPQQGPSRWFAFRSAKPSSALTRSHSVPQNLSDFPNLTGHTSGDYVGLFDGHGGPQASAFAAENFHLILRDCLNRQTSIEYAISDSFQVADEMLREFVLKLDLPDEEKICCGTACLLVFIVKGILYTANLGDSRAVICTNGRAVRLTQDHKPLLPEERRRIKSSGGVVLNTGRINGLLSVSRSLGDYHLKPFGVTSSPFLYSYPITSQDEFLIMACDGLWDVISEETAIRIVQMEGKDPHRASARLRDLAYLRGSSDNISVIVVTLSG